MSEGFSRIQLFFVNFTSEVKEQDWLDTCQSPLLWRFEQISQGYPTLSLKSIGELFSPIFVWNCHSQAAGRFPLTLEPYWWLKIPMSWSSQWWNEFAKSRWKAALVRLIYCTDNQEYQYQLNLINREKVIRAYPNNSLQEIAQFV